MKIGALLPLCLLLWPLQSGAAFFDDDNAPQSVAATGVAFETAFSTQGAMSPAVAKALGEAKTSIRMSAYDFTSKPVSEAVLKAQRSGVDTKVLLDKKKSASPFSAAQFFLTMNLTPQAPKGGKELRENYLVIDGRDLILGNIAEFADTQEETNAAGSVLIIRNAPELAKRYLADWDARWADSEALKPQK